MDDRDADRIALACTEKVVRHAHTVLQFTLGQAEVLPLPPEGVSAADWLRDLRRRGYAVVMVADERPALRATGLYLAARDVIAVAEGDLTSGPEFEATPEKIQSICEALFCGPDNASYQIPARWWRAGLGRICRLADAMHDHDTTLIPFEELAQRHGLTVEELAKRLGGRTRYAFPDELDENAD
jgi:hypothetical protein